MAMFLAFFDITGLRSVAWLWQYVGGGANRPKRLSTRGTRGPFPMNSVIPNKGKTLLAVQKCFWLFLISLD